MSNKRVFYRGLNEHDHVYTDCGEDKIGIMMRSSFETGICPICENPTAQYSHSPHRRSNQYNPQQKVIILKPIISICSICGWWQSKAECVSDDISDNLGVPQWAYSYSPIIEKINISSNSIAISDLRNHLLKKWDEKKLISAGKTEELVQSLLKEHFQCDVFSATSNVNTSDGGIDLFVCHENGEIISAVQVKRRITKETEPVSEVRDFVGALTIENIKKGIFVTTAEKFSVHANKIPEKLNNRLELDLINGEELFELLKCYTKPEELVIPPYTKEDMLWSDQNGNIFSTSQLIGI